MPPARNDVELRRDERLRDSARQSTSMTLPLAIHHKLDELAYLAADANPTRAEIIAALIAFAETDSDVLEQLVFGYRKLTVGDLIPARARDDAGGEDNVVHLQPRAPGRPKQPRAG